MDLCWLHVSDFHFRGGDTYDSHVVLRALVKYVGTLRTQDRRFDLIFATGDIANAGKPQEYELATRFFDELLEAAGLKRSRLFVVPGNHDVDRDGAVGLARTLTSREEADLYFAPDRTKPHVGRKQHAFSEWHDQYFDGIRRFPEFSTCGPIEVVQVKGHRIGVLCLNSALFCQDDNDHAKLLVGRRCLDSALTELEELSPSFKVALIHHPLDWLSDLERSNIKASIQKHVDVVLRGHLHETDADMVTSVTGTTVHFAAGAAYQTRKWPNRALYVTLESRGELRVSPIRYEDSPVELWTVDPSVFPEDPGYERRISIPRTHMAKPAAPALPIQRQKPTPYRSNIAARGDLPFLGRVELLDEIARELRDTTHERVVILHGPPGAGKTELAREYARLSADKYPGGRFFINADAEETDLARIGANILELQFPANLPFRDRCEQTLLAMHGETTLLIYDNPSSKQAIEPWLPRSGMPCHVLVTTVNERWSEEWPGFEVPPLSEATSLELIEKVGGPVVAERFGRDLAALSGGLPVEIVPASLALGYEQRRGRLGAATLDITQEASGSFDIALRTLDPPPRLLLYAAAFLAQQHVDRDELFYLLEPEYKGGRAEFERALDVCRDLHLLQGHSELRMHQLFGSYLVKRSAQDLALAPSLRDFQIRRKDRFLAVAEHLRAAPADAGLQVAILSYPLTTAYWDREIAMTADDRYAVGFALATIGRYDEARSWVERAVEEKARGDAHGRVDHWTLGANLHLLGCCLRDAGKFTEARPWFERAVTEAEYGDTHGRVDHERRGSFLHQVGYCLSMVGKFDEARDWAERAIEEKARGDVDCRIDHESTGQSQHLLAECLFNGGNFDDARPWVDRAVEEKAKGNVNGCVDHDSLGASLYLLGTCLSTTGKFDDARPRFERAVKEMEQGDMHGRVNHASLGAALHQVGYCLAATGKFDEARPWFERAVQEAEQGDVHGRVDHVSVGTSLHGLGDCLSQAGRFDEARSWFERAVNELEQGDMHGRVNHDGLGASLHQVGYCLSRTGKFDAARSWLERAVKEKEQGDVHGRVNHESLGASLHLLGYGLSNAGKFDEAWPWFDRAAREMEQGDEHGRINHDSLGTSLHLLGHCLSSTGKFDEARSRFESAVKEAQRGDAHGRVDHESVGRNLHRVGDCLFNAGEVDKARSWFERAVEEREQGDVHGRVDHEGLGTSLFVVGCCLASEGKFDQARPWVERAVNEHEQGDVHGRVQHKRLGGSLHLLGYCLFSAGKFDEARPWFERALKETEEGDEHGRIDHDTVGRNAHRIGDCLFHVGELDQARSWFGRAVKEWEHGDVNGRVDHEHLGRSLHGLAACLCRAGRFDDARPLLERAVKEKEQGDTCGRINEESLESSREALASLPKSMTPEPTVVKRGWTRLQKWLRRFLHLAARAWTLLSKRA